MRIGKNDIDISNTDKVFFPDADITKGDLINYYSEIGKLMLKHIKDRPLTMHRFPDGIEKDGFYQKDASDYFPDWIQTKTVEKEGGTVRHVVCNDTSTLVYIANLGCITPHIWLSRIDNLQKPDRMIFDLDPADGGFEQVRKTAGCFRRILADELGLISYLMTTGSRGLHVVVPVKPEFDFDDIREFAKGVTHVLASRYPDELTTEIRKEKRGGRLFLDIARNAYAQTAVAPYSVRAKPGAPVATPIDWDELEGPDINPRKYNTRNIFRRLSQKEDPWAEMSRHARSISKANETLKGIKNGS